MAPALLGVASRRRTLAALLAGAITLLGGAFRRDTDARDKRKSCKNIADQTPRQHCLASPRRVGAPIERLLSARNPGGNDRRNATFSFSRLRNDADARDESALPPQSPHPPHKRKHHDAQDKRKHHDAQDKRERDRSRGTKNKADAPVKTIDDNTHNDKSNTKTLLWTKLFPRTLTETNIQRIAFARFNGFQIINEHRGRFDDIQNGGVSRMPPGHYKQLAETISNAATSSRDLGMDRLFIHLTSLDFDVYAPEDVDTMIQTTRAQAAFALETGLAGIWLDAEDYQQRNIWVQEQDPGKRAFGRAEEEVQEHYVAAGQQFVQAVIAEYPEADILLAPSLHLSVVHASYTHLADFYKGMASVNNPMGIVITTELSYPSSREDELRTVARDEEQHLAENSSVALGYWAMDESAETIDALAEAVRIGRQYSGKYNWVYDEAGIFVQDSPHSCAWEGWGPGHSCLAKPLQELLPPL